MKGNARTVALVVIGVVTLIVAGWIVTVILFKAGERSEPPHTVTVTTVQG